MLLVACPSQETVKCWAQAHRMARLRWKNNLIIFLLGFWKVPRIGQTKFCKFGIGVLKVTFGPKFQKVNLYFKVFFIMLTIPRCGRSKQDSHWEGLRRLTVRVLLASHSAEMVVSSWALVSIRLSASMVLNQVSIHHKYFYSNSVSTTSIYTQIVYPPQVFILK